MAKKRKRNRQRNQPAGNEAAAPAAAAPAAPPPPAEARGSEPRRRSAPAFDAFWLLVGLSVAGVALTAYLTGSRLAGAELAACGVGSSCDLVQQSRWSTLFGVPLAVWGLLTYLAIGAAVWRSRRRPAAWTWALFMALVALAISLYLQAVSVFAIEAVCPWCVASAVLMAVIFVTLALFRPARAGGFRWASFAPSSLLMAGVVVGLMHLHYAGAFNPAHGPERPYLRDLAIHLSDSGARFYGAYWCPHCQEQKRLFEASVERLPYVECSPNGRGTPLSTACAAAAIRDYPTWMIDGRRYTGVLSPERLADLSGFKG